jgi:endogenous inhibitor of DNA gyrase (YacG/DUF329 family)
MGDAHKGRDMPNKPRTGRYVPCEVCGKEFWRQKHQERKGVGRFCSIVCKDVEQSKNRETKTCAICGKTWTLSASQKYHRADYCSRDCYSRARMKRPLDREHNGKPAVVDQHGYVRIYEPDHPRAFGGGWVFEHRWVVEQQLGRYLDPDEHVHHINHVRMDNRPENLKAMTALEHMAITGRENGEALKAAIEARQLVQKYIQRFGPLE